MKSFFVLCLTTCNTKTVFEVVNGFFYIYTYFVSGISFFRITNTSWVSTKIFFRVDVDHSSAGRSCAWVITMAYTLGFLSSTVPFPFHFRTDEFHSGKSATQMRFASFTLHWKRWIMWTTGNTFVIDSIINPFNFQLVFQRNTGLFKGCFL